MRKSFRGGVHPFDGKALTADAAVQKLTPTGDTVYPLRQHIGKPALPLVKKGDVVSVGQQIAAAADRMIAVTAAVRHIFRIRMVPAPDFPASTRGKTFLQSLPARKQQTQRKPA